MERKILKKKIHNYTAVFEPDKEVRGYTVTIPSLPGCISEGDTFEETLKNIQEAAQAYIWKSIPRHPGEAESLDRIS